MGRYGSSRMCHYAEYKELHVHVYTLPNVTAVWYTYASSLAHYNSTGWGSHSERVGLAGESQVNLPPITEIASSYSDGEGRTMNTS